MWNERAHCQNAFRASLAKPVHPHFDLAFLTGRMEKKEFIVLLWLSLVLERGQMLLSFSLPLFKMRKKEEMERLLFVCQILACPSHSFFGIWRLALFLATSPFLFGHYWWFLGLDVLLMWIRLWSRSVISSCLSGPFHLPRDFFVSNTSVW